MDFLREWGFSPFFERQQQEQTDDTLVAARVTEEQKGFWRVVCVLGEHWAKASGRLHRDGKDGGLWPAVGDWVWVSVTPGTPPTLLVEAVFERQSKISRRAAGTEEKEQIIASNVDYVFIASSLNQDFSARRLERYLAVVRESGALPVVLLTKADLCADSAPALAEACKVAKQAPVHVVSASSGLGLSELQDYLEPGKTLAIVGSSGVGKSTLLNALAGDKVQVTQDIREGDAKGRHTTTSRRLVKLSNGSLFIDTPGMREVQLWGTDEGVAQTFADIEELAVRCRFTNCRHADEPGCAVRAALASGDLSSERMESFEKLQRELAHQHRKVDKVAMSEEKSKWKSIHKGQREVKKRKRPW